MTLEFYNHYPAPISFEQNSLKPTLKKLLQKLSRDELILSNAVLHQLELIEFNLVDDSTISSVHDTFMSDPSPTDVITFQHGEIFVSYDTASKEAQERGISLKEELLRYHVHGILHLAGYDDLTDADYETMHNLQEKLMAEL